MAFRLRCKASKPGFYGDRMHYPDGSKDNEKRAGAVFVLQADGLRYDSEGKMEVDAKLCPILPSWVLPLDEVKPINPKETPHVIKAAKPRFAKRNLPAEARAAAPRPWPANVMDKDTMDEERVVRPKRAGTATASQEDED